MLVVLLGLIVLRASTDRPRQQAVPSPAPSELISTVPDGPTASGACGVDTLLPVVSSAPPAEHTAPQPDVFELS